LPDFDGLRTWESNPFLTFENGYQIRISADWDFEDSNLVVFVHLMRGPYDKELEMLGYFPMNGYYTVEMVNPLEQTSWFIGFMTTNRKRCYAIECTGRGIPIIDSGIAELKDGTLYCRISYTHVSTLYKYVSLVSIGTITFGLIGLAVLCCAYCCGFRNIIWKMVLLVFLVLGILFGIGCSVTTTVTGGILWLLSTVASGWAVCAISGFTYTRMLAAMLVGGVIARLLLVNVLDMPWNWPWI